MAFDMLISDRCADVCSSDLLRHTTVRRLQRPVRSVDMPQQCKDLICPRAIPMGHKVLQRGPNQLRSRFEIVVLSPNIMMDAGVGMRPRRALEQVLRSILYSRRPWSEPLTFGRDRKSVV